MSEVAIAVEATDPCADTVLAEYIDNASRYTGEGTSAQKTMMVMLLSREGRSQTAIASILGMDFRTVKAILARQDSLIADGRMLLKANTLGFVGDAITASQEAAKRGKLEGISAMLDRLGVTEPPKSQHQAQVAVQINLHGGPEPVSLAKVETRSESLSNQAQSEPGLIMGLMSTQTTPQDHE